MITLTTEQTQQIEEALDKARWSQSNTKYVHADYDKTMEALATIRAAIAQQQYSFATNCPKCKSEISHWSWCPDFVAPVKQKKEPVAVVVLDTDHDTFGSSLSDRKSIVPYKSISNLEVGTKLYAHLVCTKDLTPEEIGRSWVIGMTLNEYARAIIEKFKEKNNAA